MKFIGIMRHTKNWILRLGAIAALGWLACQAADPAVPADDGHGESTPPARASKAAETHEADPEPRRVRRQEIISIGGSARVAPNEQSREVVVVAGDVELEGEVRGDVVVVFGRLHLTGSVSGDVVVVAGQADIDGKISGNVVLPFTRTTLGEHADLRGEILVIGADPEIHPSARLRQPPEIVSVGPLMQYFDWLRDYVTQGVLLMRPFPPRVGWVWVAAGAFLVFHLFLALLLGGPLRSCMAVVRERPASSFFVGLVACILVGPVSVLLSFTLIAPPLLWLVFIALTIFGRVAVYAAAGAGLGRLGSGTGLSQPVPAVFVGSILFYLAYMIPFVGYLVFWLVIPWGVGACLLRAFEALSREGRRGGPGVTAPPLGGAQGTGIPPIPPGPVVPVSSVSAAASLAAGLSGPATHAAVVDPPPITASFPGPEAPADPPTGVPTKSPFAGSEALLLPRVGCGPRLGAAFIDLMVLLFVNGVTFASPRWFILLLAAYHVGMWVWRGTTLGGTILGLKLVRLDGRRLDWQTAGVRALAAIISLLPLGLGFFWASWDEQFQSWHDRIAGTTIVKSDRRTSLV